MLDDFVYGEVTRISPEAPTPVLAVRHSEVEIGGAGNVARNIAALGSKCILVSLIGNDEAGLTLTNALGKFDGLIVPDLVIDKARQTTRKVRFVSEHHSTHLMRADWETTDRLCRNDDAASGRRGVVRLCQGHADAARHPRHH
jgi:D-beta-D-heptose 7-phosphate kinase/D-beta-D-heptose 1-phosphate adenosyltransferase